MGQKEVPGIANRGRTALGVIVGTFCKESQQALASGDDTVPLDHCYVRDFKNRPRGERTDYHEEAPQVPGE